MDIFDPKHLRRPDPILFYNRRDPNDPRMGGKVASNFDAYGESQVVILGCPQDDGVLRNGGRSGADSGPTEIRRSLYGLTTNGIRNSLKILDLGDIVPQPRLEATHALQQQWVQRLLEDGKRVITLGGGSDIAYPDCSALSLVAPHMMAINIDAHFDVSADTTYSSGTPFRQLLEEAYIRPQLLCEIAYQPQVNSPVYEQYLRDRSANLCSLRALRELGIAPTFKRMLRNKSKFDAIFWAFDLDSVRRSDAPGVSSPNADGLSADEFCRIAEIAGSDERTRIIEFVEVNPAWDSDSATSRLAALAIHHYLSALGTVWEATAAQASS